MIKLFMVSLFTFLLASYTSAARGCDNQTGERVQHVFLDYAGTYIENWIVTSDKIKAVNLPNGFKLGIQIEPASREKYEEYLQDANYVSETVRITLYDLSDSTPKRLTFTFGGTNSLQGYGAKGGADRVVELGDPGVQLLLIKPVCVSKQQLQHR